VQSVLQSRLAWRSNEAEMNELHQAYLSLGSNIEPELNLVRGIGLLQTRGRVEKVSKAWESESVGAEGPNYLNACVLFVTPLNQAALKEQVLLPIEAQLGRRRTENRFAPRPIDIDIVIFDERSCDDKYWEQAFVVIPLAEIHPYFRNPVQNETLAETATRLRSGIWMEARRDVLSPFNGNRPAA
jgi:2-amino-4-hydroxy-6-hydroxymethyldihydropteridine diphosphokinase